MLDFFESLPFSVSTLVAAIVSIAVVASVSRLMPFRAMWAVALVVPFMVSYALYWAPYWLGHSPNRSDYSAWEPIFLTCWGLAGVVGSLIFVLILGKRRKDKLPHV
jgi:hypothetical protein